MRFIFLAIFALFLTAGYSQSDCLIVIPTRGTDSVVLNTNQILYAVQAPSSSTANIVIADFSNVQTRISLDSLIALLPDLIKFTDSQNNYPTGINKQQIREIKRASNNKAVIFVDWNKQLRYTSTQSYLSIRTLADACSSGSGVTNGNKGDITVLSNTWNINDSVVGLDQLQVEGTSSPGSTIVVNGGGTGLEWGTGGGLIDQVLTEDIEISGNRTVQFKNDIIIGDTIARLGEIFSDNFNRASLGANYAQAGGGTLTFPSSAYMQIAGAPVNFNNYITREYVTGANRWYQSLIVVPTVVDGSSFGIGIGQRSSGGFTAGLIVQYSLTSGSNFIYIRDQAGTTLATSSSFTVTALDSLKIEVTRVDNYINASITKLATGVTTTVNYTNNLASVSVPVSRSGKFVLHFIGGTQRIRNWTARIDEVKYKAVVLGNSIMAGYSASNVNARWVNQIWPTREVVNLSGGPGDRSSDGVLKHSEILSFSPSYVLYCLGTNDLTNSVTAPAYATNVKATIDYCQANSIPIILVTVPPNNSFNATVYNDSLFAIATREGIQIINTWDELRTGTSFTTGLGADGTHPSDAGHTVIAETISAGISGIDKNYGLSLLNIESSESRKDRLMLLDSLGNVKRGARYEDVRLLTDRLIYGTDIGSQYGLSVTASTSNGFIGAMQNTAADGWSGMVLRQENGTIGSMFGVANVSTNVSYDSSFLFQTYSSRTDRFLFNAGDRSSVLGPSDFIIGYRTAVLPSRTTANRITKYGVGSFGYNSDNLQAEILIGGLWRNLSNSVTSSAILDFPNTVSGTSSLLTITVTGAATTDKCVSIQRDNASISGTMYEAVVTAANTVTVYFHNFSGSDQNPASGTFQACVTK